MPEFITNIQWTVYLSHLASLAVALILALPIGWDREKETRSMGFRTFPLVAVAYCGYILIGLDIAANNPDALSRLLYGLMTGIGFIGGGAILKSDNNVHGTATAASIWNTGAIGAAVAFQRFEIALILATVNFVILRFMSPIKDKLIE